MRKNELLVSFAVEGKLVLDIMPYMLQKITMKDIVEQLSGEECKELLLSNSQNLMADMYTVEGVVKKVIDDFDPFGLDPRGPFGDTCNEYDPESNAIAEEIEYGMSVDEITEVIEDVFEFFFEAGFDTERYRRPAIKIAYYLDMLNGKLKEDEDDDFF